ncbi:translocation protein Sec66 [Aspergillus sp. HF37]|nr:translocation protein Sec66 [Aspergillus sp. HF37]
MVDWLKKASSLEPWFPPHLQRDIYFSLLHLDAPAAASSSTNGSGGKKTPPVPDSVLKAALLRRATEDINRVLALRSQKQALAMLLQRGSVGDDLWQRFQRAEKEMEDEVRDVVSEANAYAPNWGQTIFQSANEMMNNGLVRKIVDEHQAKLGEEREWWDRRKASIKQGFMKELDAEGSGSVAAGGAGAAKGEGLNPGTTGPQTSDDDAVMVEADETAAGSTASANTGGGGGGGGGKKKKKGKK